MKKYKSRILIFAIILLLISGSGYAYVRHTLNKFHEDNIEIADIEDDINNEESGNEIDEADDTSEDKKENDEDKKEDTEEQELDPYVKMIRDSDRINILCLGVANPLTDTMIVVSIDPDKNQMDLISVPRDTYYYREEYAMDSFQKINACYVGKTSAERAQSSMNAVRDVLNIPIHDFVKIEYKGVEEIVDTIGGVEVYIPFDMDYDDQPGNLHIHFKKGKKLLNGKEAVEFLRFRKNNDGTHSDGDLGRITRQQEFIMKAIDKSMGLEILGVVNVAQDYIRTSLTDIEMLSFANRLRKLDTENINSYTLPGEAKYINGISFYVKDEEKIKEMITEIYTKE
ncbi:LCP family protein [Sporosalibacterium faouarense]|uniref:LCP family protein n=1 Tax=Sporosalibacterium faouarense TaxID=516123 RepID=UPI00141C6737|nr:LCP family protein [Sporosalibacterium faouarense]MTI49862.1 LytR family transcriptional regulator [Bacillota bacterium]